MTLPNSSMVNTVSTSQTSATAWVWMFSDNKPLTNTWQNYAVAQKTPRTTSAKPLVYQVSMIDDGSTLSGIARLFYGDATKWAQIYDANRSILKKPDLIRDGMGLTIPKLK